MEKQTEEINQRWIACPQSTGRAGKSMTLEGVISWLDFAGVEHAILDTDIQHHTISDRHETPILDVTNSENEFHQMLETLPNHPVLLVDFPGNRTGKILEYAATFQMKHLFEKRKVRPTLFVFMADDETAKESAMATLEFFGTSADYILVENSARFSSASFKATPLYDSFKALGAPTLVVPRIAQGALDGWEAAQFRAGNGLSLDEVCKADGLSDVSFLTLSGFRDRFLVQCEDCASVLLPNISLIKNKVKRSTEVVPKPVNKFANKMLLRK